MTIILKNARVIDPTCGLDTQTDLRIVDGVIEKIAPGQAGEKKAEILDLTGRIITPGFVDMHVHLREPGFEHKETIETGCHAAIAGGFTSVCCMPNTNPAIDEASIVRYIIERGRSVHGGIIDVYPIAAVTKGREGKLLAPMIELAEAGAVGFTDDGAPVADAEMMRRALEYSGMLGKPIIQHAEEMSMTRGGAMNEGLTSTILGIPAMPSIAEDIIVQRDIQMLRYLGGQYHVAHISTKGAVDLVRSAKKDRLPVTCEVTPHHFTICDDEVRSFDTNTKMNPPLRSKEDVEAMKEGLRDGTIDVIATDHAPHSFDEKQVEFQHAPFGIVGLETAVGLCFTELIHAKVITLPQLIEKLSVNPRRILHLPEIPISEGSRACLTFLDPNLEWKVDTARLMSKSNNSPFHNRLLKGRAIGIFNNGKLNFQTSLS